MSDHFICDACGEEFQVEPGWDPWDEAEAAFSPAELEDVAKVCDDCWMQMRAAMPDLDARYSA